MLFILFWSFILLFPFPHCVIRLLSMMHIILPILLLALLFLMQNLRDNITITIEGFINPIPTAFCLVYNAARGNLHSNPSFLLMVSLHMILSSLCCFSVKFIMPVPKNALFIKQALKYRQVS